MRTPVLAMSILACAAACTPTMAMTDTVIVHKAQRWLYRCVTASDMQSFAQHANELGVNGWELAAAATSPAGTIWCFKRPQDPR